MYKKSIIKGFKDIANNKKILLVEFFYGLYLFISVSIITVVLEKLTGFMSFIGVLRKLAIAEEIKETIFIFTKNNIWTLVITIGIFVIVSFVVGSGLTAMKWYAVSQVARKKRLHVADMIKGMRKYVKKVVVIKIYSFCYLIAPILAGVLLFTILQTVTLPFAAFVISATLGVIGYFIVFLSLFYRYAILVSKKKAMSARVMRDSLAFFKKHKSFVIGAMICAYLIPIIARVILDLIGLVVPLLNIIIYIISLWILTTWMPLFIMNTFIAKKTKRR